MFHERHSRTIFKSITWRITAVLSTLVIMFMLTRDYSLSLYYTIVINIIKSVLYYLHERIWNISNFGLELKKK